MVPIHREGWRFVAIFALVSLGLGFLWGPLFWIGLVLTAWCAYFFRDPVRVTPMRGDGAPGLVISPADGVVNLISVVAPPKELDMGAEPMTRVSVFMNVFDVHVNRSPVAGTVAKLAYTPGKFLNAALDKASEDNERMALRLRLDDGRELAVVQIAGLVARRILCWTKEGATLGAGERFGMIRFGSRVDVYLPHGVTPLVAVGQRAVAGETVIADLGPEQEGGRAGVSR